MINIPIDTILAKTCKNIYISYSPDMKYWGEHRCVMKAAAFEDSAWQSAKIGAGPIPILTDEGWLMIYL